jgi:hypothetical protein
MRVLECFVHLCCELYDPNLAYLPSLRAGSSGVSRPSGLYIYLEQELALEFLEVDPRACSQATTSLPILHPWCKSMNDGRAECHDACGIDRNVIFS